jgi:hypothetical protein
VKRARVLLGAAVAACVLIVPGVGAQTAPATVHALVGVGDENTDLFSDPRFLALGIRYVRFYMSWDVLSSLYRNHYRRNVLEAWLADARAEGLTPLITIDHSDRKGQGGHLPSVSQYSRAFLEFHRLYPWVTEFATWNEANYYGEPTAGNPKRVAQYYLALRRDCRTCTILAAELLDLNNPREAVPMVKWARALVRDAHTQPAYWGLHDYASANVLSDASTKRLLDAVSGNIWLTETGGIVELPHHGKVGFPLTDSHEARVDNYILNTVTALSPRIQRVYLYEWRPARRKSSWDTALLNYNGTPRPAYDVLAKTLAAWGIEPDCAISSAPPACLGATGSSGTSGVSGVTATTGVTGNTQSGGSRPPVSGPP